MPAIFTSSMSQFVAGQLAAQDKAVFSVATDIHRTSQILAPVDTGALKSSHEIARQGQAKYEISANTPYARRRHYENDLHPGTKRYLERAGQAASRNPDKYFRGLM